MMKAKVFGIGFHKTGTKSLAKALGILGYRVTGPNGTRNPNIADSAQTLALSLLDHYDAFQDNPWPLLYRTLDARCPNSKFILTLRPETEWIASVVRYFGADSTPMRQWIYGAGSPVGHQQAYLERYRRHNLEVTEYFASRDDLLVLRVTEGEGWERLCPFLGLPVPGVPFPAENRALSSH